MEREREREYPFFHQKCLQDEYFARDVDCFDVFDRTSYFVLGKCFAIYKNLSEMKSYGIHQHDYANSVHLLLIYRSTR